MTERLGDTPTYEYKNPERGNITERLDTVVEVLGFEEDSATAEARAALVDRIGADEQYDRDNSEHRDLLIAYQDTGVAALGDHPEPGPVIGFDVAQAIMWLNVGDVERFRDRLDPDDGSGVVEALFDTRDDRLDAAAVEVLAIMDDLEDQMNS